MAWPAERWVDLLGRWEALLADEDPEGQATVGHLRRPGAANEEVDALESRLGRRLPPSYRSFLLVTNGLPEASMTYETRPVGDPGYEGFLQAASVRTVVRTLPFTVMLWVVPDTWAGASPFDVEGDLAAHLSFEDPIPEQLRVGHLLHAIAVTGGRQHGNVFLDPLSVDADGEWEAWRWDSDGGMRFRSFGDLIEQDLADAAVTEVQVLDVLRNRDLEAVDRLAERAEAGDSAALQELVALARGGSPVGARGLAVRGLAGSSSETLGASLVRLMLENPSDPVVVGNASQGYGVWRRLPQAEAAVTAALRGEAGEAVASSIVHGWPEPVEKEHARTGDPVWLRHLLFARRPGALEPALAALADPQLDPGTRGWITYTLSHSTAWLPDPPQISRVVALADVPGTDLLHLVQALLGWGAEDEAVGLLARALPDELTSGTAAYALAQLAGLRLGAAAPLLRSALEQTGSQEVLRTLAFIDHPDSVPVIAAHLDDQLRPHALLALEQVAADRDAVHRAAAVEALGTRAAVGDLEAARALARVGEARALGPLLAAVRRDTAAATAGLADLMHPDGLPLLRTIATQDADARTATIAASGLVRAYAAGRGPATDLQLAVEALSGRSGSCRRLAARWAALGDQQS